MSIEDTPADVPATGERAPSRVAQLFKALGGLGALIIAWSFIATMTTILITVGIWPGEAKLTAPLFCDDAHPDPFVVSDSYQPSPGETTTNFTLYCVGPRGDAVDIGFARPFLVLSLAHGLLLTGAAVVAPVFGGRGRIGRARPDRDVTVDGDPPTDAVDWPSGDQPS